MADFTIVANENPSIAIQVPGQQGPSGPASDQGLTTVASASGTYNVDITTNGVYDITVTGNISFTFTNAPLPNQALSAVIVIRVGGAGGWTYTWPAGMKWALGAPSIPATAGSIYVLTVMNINGTLFGFPAGEAI